MRDLPNMTVIAPSDSAQCIKAIRATLEYPGPVCFRIARGAEPAVYTTQDYDYEVGQAITALDGTDLTIIATDSLVALSISAANGLDHIDRADRVDADDIFRRRVARRYTGGVDDLRHVAEGSGELRQRLHLRAIRNVRFAKVALHAKLVQLRFCRFHLCEVAPRQHDHGRFSKLLTDRLFPCRRDRLSRP